MIVTCVIDGNLFRVDLSKPHDISIPLRAGEMNVNAFHIPPMQIQPFRAGSFTGDVKQGGSCNVNNIFFNPHGNGTHTECVGHISAEGHTINQSLQRFFFLAELVSITPQTVFDDHIIKKEHLLTALGDKHPEALIIRTRPNTELKLNRHYSGTNPAYLHHDAAALIRERGIEHLLLDVPSVDKEEDGGKLLAHHEFWNYPGSPRTGATITEMIYVPDEIKDGSYLLNLQIASFENDASPSKPLLYRMIKG
ncbi:MAG TPA: cyclase family protein [Bacteroidia bacterium]|nr:cyclase family protein [Bacteroidia bacterium]